MQHLASPKQKRLSLKKIALLPALPIVSGLSFLVYIAYAYRFQVLPQISYTLLDAVPKPTRRDRIVLFAPHPDDETIAAGGYLATAVKKGAHVSVVLVTDGNKHGLEIKRYREFYKACDLLGIDHDNLIFFDYPDGTLIKQKRGQVRSRCAKVLQELKPTIVIAPHLEDTHRDHAVLGSIMYSLTRKQSIVLYQYLVHHPWYPQPRRFDTSLYLLPPVRMVQTKRQWQTFELSSDLIDRKLEAVLQYRTQLRSPFLKDILMGLVRKNELFSIVDPK